jgi:uncharacterized membrane protein
MERSDSPRMRRGHAFLLAAALPLFLGALLCDLAYRSSFELQWSNFAAWLMAGGLVFAGIALVLSLVDLFRGGGRGVAYFLLLLASFVAGFINSLVHARDAWAVMPTGLWLSVLVLLLTTAATAWVFASLRQGDRP